jgi:hypothetical protein
MDWVKKNAGPILYTIVCVISIWFFYWFGALYH